MTWAGLSRSQGADAARDLSARTDAGRATVEAHVEQRSLDIGLKLDEMSVATNVMVVGFEGSIEQGAALNIVRLNDAISSVGDDVSAVATEGVKKSERLVERSRSKGRDEYREREKKSDKHVIKKLR